MAVGFPALAADIPPAPAYRSPPVVAPATHGWTGCFIGAHGGYGWGNKHWTGENDTDIGHRIDGALAGGQVGCDWQADRFVFGIEGQMAWANLKGNAITIVDGLGASISDSRVDALGIVVGRLGVAFDRTLLYVNGGVAFAKEQHGLIAEIPTVISLEASSGRIWRTGWTVGAGIEHALAPNWTVKLEYSYMNFGTREVSLGVQECFVVIVGPCPTSIDVNVDQHVHAIKAGINYRFGQRPVTARY